MPLLPYDRFDIRSPYPASELAARLAANVEPRRLLRFGRAERLFEGTVYTTRFDIKRIIDRKNSVTPRLSGTIEPAAGGSQLRGTMSLHSLELVFLTMWVGLAVTMGLGMIATAGREGFSLPMLVPFGLAFYAPVLVSTWFTAEARKTHSLLREIAGASPAPQRKVRETPA